MKFIKYEDTYVNLNQVTLFKKVADYCTDYTIYKIQFVTEAIDFTFDFEAEKERDEFFKKIERILGISEETKVEDGRGWQPILTAPSNQDILVTNGEAFSLARRYYNSVDLTRNWSFWNIFVTSDEEKLSFSHWTPIPKLPKIEVKNDK